MACFEATLFFFLNFLLIFLGPLGLEQPLLLKLFVLFPLLPLPLPCLLKVTFEILVVCLLPFFDYGFLLLRLSVVQHSILFNLGTPLLPHFTTLVSDAVSPFHLLLKLGLVLHVSLPLFTPRPLVPVDVV